MSEQRGGRGRARGRAREEGGQGGQQQQGGPRPGFSRGGGGRGAPQGGPGGAPSAWGAPQQQATPTGAWGPPRSGPQAPQAGAWSTQPRGPPPTQQQQQQPQQQQQSAGRAAHRPEAGGGPAHGGGERSVAGLVAAGGNGGNGDNNGGNGAAGRGGIRGRRAIPEHVIIRTKPVDMTSKKGSYGAPTVVLTNYFKLINHTRWTLNQYRVDFSPDIDLTKDRKRYVHTAVREILSGYIFDGTVLYTPRRLEPQPMTRTVDHLNNPDDKVNITFRCVGDITEGDYHFIQVFNLIMRRCMGRLDLQLMGRDFFDAKAKIPVPQFKLEIWPGYDNTIRQHENEILMGVDVKYKISRTDRVLQILDECIQGNRQDGRANFTKEVVGAIVITDYNNKSMKIDDIDWDKSPASTFPKSDGTQISFIDYYKTQYGVTIRNPTQPLLVSRASARELRGGMSEIKLLVPELCRMTGLTEGQRGNIQLMRAVAEHTRVAPAARVSSLYKFSERLLGKKEIVDDLKSWDFELDKKLVEVQARILPQEEIIVGGGKTYLSGPEVDWTRQLRSNPMLSLGRCEVFVVMFPNRLNQQTKSFLRMLDQAARGMSWRLPEPAYVEMNDDRPGTYVQQLEGVCNKYKPNIIMCVVSNNKSDRYAAIKKKLCVDRAVPSQVIVGRNLDSKGAMSIATKVAIQMNCKLGGAPWTVKIPLKSAMTVGYDVCHEPGKKSNSFGAFCATTQVNCATHFSSVQAHTTGDDQSHNFGLQVITCAKAYAAKNGGAYPERIFIFRDGVGEGDEHYVMKNEVEDVKQSLAPFYPDGGLKLAFIIVTKRIRTRFFANNRGQIVNPSPGTVVDDVVTKPERFDFYIVSQCVRQGTVAPTNYNVLYNTSGLTPDQLQRYTYRMTHLYYNWSGTVRVPAPCQYAHRLAFLVAQSLRRAPNENLTDRLYYL